MSEYYEEERVLAEYLNFHFRGDTPDYLPLHPLPEGVLGYPKRCADVLVQHAQGFERVLDLGCAVGRSSFELSRHFSAVLGVDFSHRFIETASALQSEGGFRYSETIEGGVSEVRNIELDSEWNPDRIQFEVGDACNLRGDLGTFDAVLMANLLCRLPDPAGCLRRMVEVLNPGGVLVLTTPCSWDTAYTDQDRWLDADGLRSLLSPHLEPVLEGDMPFVLREHRRKAQFTVARLTVWRK